MARILNLAVHTVRREAFVEAAQRLMQSRGYQQMSIQDVLDELQASRGAFYHYFDSKQALLEAVIDVSSRIEALHATLCPGAWPVPTQTRARTPTLGDGQQSTESQLVTTKRLSPLSSARR